MGDMGDYWNDIKDSIKVASVLRRANNRRDSVEMLKRNAIEFNSRNSGAHLIVTAYGGVYDFWPSTGTWVKRGTQKYKRGVRLLIKTIRESQPVDDENTGSVHAEKLN